MIDLIILGVAIVIFGFSVVITREKTLKVIQRLGKFHRIAKPGFSMRIPIFDQVVGVMSLRIEELAEEITVKSKDNAFVSIPVKAQFKVIEEKGKDAFYILNDPHRQIKSYISNVVRSTATAMDMDEIFRSKDLFEKKVQEELNDKFTGYGYQMVNVLVDDPSPSDEVARAFDQVIASKRDKEAATNKAEAIKVMMVGEAEAEGKSLEIKASAYVKQREIIAKGLEELGINGPQLLAFLERIDWRDAIRDAAGNKGSLIIVPADMNLGGEVAKIKALTQE